ncbi:MAG: RHS repeat protein [Bifidobacteriaceae bacterium]|nr:RHS repeat protein [Bifidobacteriaceae bacterium]
MRTAYAYDPRGLLTSITNPLGGVTSYEYGPNGQVSKPEF